MKYGLIGEKLGHSFSKIIHESIADYSYELKEISKVGLELFMKEKSFTGINVTIPYKTAVMPYLDYIDEKAQKIGAVNTVVNRDGILYGYNTDFDGLTGLLLKNKFYLEGKKVLILGTGGTSKTAAAVCESLMASQIITVSRKGEVNYGNVCELHSDAAYIINTTPCGMYPDNFSSPLKLASFDRLEGVADVIYNPLKTALCLEAEKLGIKNCNGLYMLVHQAVIAAGKFTDTDFDTEGESDKVYRRLLKEKQNIVLVGMPGSGKSTIGKALAEKTGKLFVDTDDMIEGAFGDIPSIFKTRGEEFFRDLEAAKVREAATLSGVVIATGGGAVLRQSNVDALRLNGIIFFLDRPIENIVPTADRPLSSDYDALKKRYEERYGRYLEVSDYVIKVDGMVANSVSRITEIIK